MKISVAQADAGLAGTENRLRWLEQQARQAADAGADIIVFPELYMSGYNVGAALHQRAETQSGPFARKISALARQLSVAIAYGYPERDGDTVCNAMIFIDDHGNVLANHRKTALPPGMEHDWFAPGSGYSVFSFNGATIALVICYECEFPEIIRHVAAEGAGIVLVATAGGQDWMQVPTLVVPTRAYENGVFIAYANYCGVENGHGFCGHSCIVNPYGRDIARAGTTAEVICADLDLNVRHSARAQLPFLQEFRGLHLKPKQTER